MRKIATLFEVLSVVAAAGSATAAMTVTLDGYPYGITDGQYYVGEAVLTIDGLNYIGVSYDVKGAASIGQSWNADAYGMADLSSGAYFTKAPVDKYTKAYEQVSFLSNLFGPGNINQWVDIQHTIWSVFDPAYTADPSLIAEANNAIENGYAFSSFRYLDSPPGTNPRVQGFIVDSSNICLCPQPEPATWFLLGSGILFIAVLGHRRRAATPNF